jgi:hypothetical protein
MSKGLVMTDTALTGLWHGQYSYSCAASAPVAFEANLIESTDWLGGSITERAAGRVLLSALLGQRQGGRVEFLKTYEPNRLSFGKVAYVGSISKDALEIDGEWQTGGWSGRFLMIRARGLTQRATQKLAEPMR